MFGYQLDNRSAQAPFVPIALTPLTSLDAKWCKFFGAYAIEEVGDLMSDQSAHHSEALVQRASRFATQAHRRIDQRRKYSKQAYDVHLKAVADLVASVSDDQEMIAAAWLHDTVEDTPATLEDIEREFGAGVAGLVSDLTDVSRPGDGNRAVRKAIDRAHTARASERAKTVKLADLIDNCRDICEHDARFARVFLVEMASLLEVLGEGDPGLLQRAHKTLGKCADRLSLPLVHEVSEVVGDDLIDVTELEREFGRQQRHTLGALMRTFNAQNIAEPLRSFDGELDAERIAGYMQRKGLAVAGLRDHGVVAGYVSREGLVQGAGNAHMRRFRRDQIVAGDTSLADVVLVLTRHDYCFVRVLGEVIGVIERRDMQKPLVRMWLFGFITSIEMMLRERMLLRWPDEAWTRQMSAARLKKAQALRDERRRRSQECQLLDCLQFSDLALALLDDPKELVAFGFESKAMAKRVIKEFESLRNNLAHAQDIITYDWAQIARMAQRMEVLADES